MVGSVQLYLKCTYSSARTSWGRCAAHFSWVKGRLLLLACKIATSLVRRKIYFRVCSVCTPYASIPCNIMQREILFCKCCWFGTSGDEMHQHRGCQGTSAVVDESLTNFLKWGNKFYSIKFNKTENYFWKGKILYKRFDCENMLGWMLYISDDLFIDLCYYLMCNWIILTA